MPTLSDRLLSFILERYPFAVPAVQQALATCVDDGHATDHGSIENLRPLFCRELSRELADIAVSNLPDTTPGATASARLESARHELVAACDGFLIREAIVASLTDEERREILRGMLLTRAVDNRLKQFFLSG